MNGRLRQGPIHQIFDLSSEIEGRGGDQLRHENDIEILNGIDPEQRRGQTAPVEVALADGP